jgi:thiol-disulfide isomerase/thioredoxin
MIRTISALLLAAIATAILFAAAHSVPGLAAPAPSAATGVAAPEFNHGRDADWLNSKPLTLSGLRGKVVLLDIWTTDCWNCYHSFPWLRGVTDRFAARGLVVLGVHSPEFEREKNRPGIAARLKEYGLTNPQMLDDDFSYWRKLNNRYWPAFYLIDKQGRIRTLLVGEQHVGDRSAREFEEQIERLLGEPVATI